MILIYGPIYQQSNFSLIYSFFNYFIYKSMTYEIIEKLRMMFRANPTEFSFLLLSVHNFQSVFDFKLAFT